MAETIKSVLFIDYDSVHRALAASDRKAAGRLALRVPAWVAAIESGGLFAEGPEPAPRRRLLMRRCYADPTLLGAERSAFLSNGFQIVDCPPAEGRERNAAAIHMVLDTIDALDHPTGYEEFVLLSVDTDLSPVLIRLRAHNRSTAIYANPVTAESYKAIADAMIDEDRLLAVLLSEEQPKETVSAAALPPAERSDIEALARKVSAATNVPLFAPRTYAELFRHLVEEIAEKSYHFQSTAENVAARMAAAGRNVTRRQVVFVVKGLALKGHVFSTGDTPERLAEVFREQVVYLCENAGLNLDDKEKAVLASWIVGRVQPSAPGAAAESDIRPISAAAETTADSDGEISGSATPAKPAARSSDDQASRAARRRQGRQAASPKPDAAVTPAVAPMPAPEAPKPAAEPAKPVVEAAKPPSPPEKPPDEPKPAPVRTILSSRTTIAAPRPATATVKPGLAPSRPPIAPARPSPPPAATGSQAVRPSPLTPARPVPPPATRAPPPAAKPAPPPTQSEADKEAVESSILAAIAQAVDVLVEDSGVRPKAANAAPVAPAATSAPPEEPPPPTAPSPPPPVEEEVPEGDDIGDEIQRIIASYNRTRNQDERR